MIFIFTVRYMQRAGVAVLLWSCVFERCSFWVYTVLLTHFADLSGFSQFHESNTELPLKCSTVHSF
jgi:hypothetical protein